MECYLRDVNFIFMSHLWCVTGCFGGKNTPTWSETRCGALATLCWCLLYRRVFTQTQLKLITSGFCHELHKYVVKMARGHPPEPESDVSLFVKYCLFFFNFLIWVREIAKFLCLLLQSFAVERVLCQGAWLP